MRHRRFPNAAALLLLAATAGRAAEPDLLGEWIVVAAAPSPWGPPLGRPDAFVGSTIAFRSRAVEGMAPFGCGQAEYRTAALPAAELFQSNLEAGSASADASRLGILLPAETLMVSCDTGSFDFHRTTEGGIVTALDNALLVLKRGER